MSDAKHTPGPWVVGPSFEEDGFVEVPIGVPTDAGYFTVAVAIGGMNPDAQIANAARIAACVNWCDGLDTEGLDLAASIGRSAKVSINDSVNMELSLISQRDELLEALHRMVCNPDSKNLDFARAAIAKATTP